MVAREKNHGAGPSTPRDEKSDSEISENCHEMCRSLAWVGRELSVMREVEEDQEMCVKCSKGIHGQDFKSITALCDIPQSEKVQ
jgi:hypothetical protein